MNSSNISSNQNELYYGVALIPGTSCIDNDQLPLVFTDRKNALQCMKKYRGARFKSFSSREAAETFSLCLSEQISPTFASPIRLPDISVMIEKASPFKAPKSQEMVKLRRAIESGDADYFKQTVWSNPRYLISSGDTPAILQEGFRYNALHVAAKNKHAVMCRLIIATIEDPKFMRLLYNEDTETVCDQRIIFISDLYLNMPDKGLCETPLHFASKFGCVQCVEILTSHPKCDLNRQNKYGQKAKEIICDRCPDASTELKNQIAQFFEDRYYIPVLRSSDNSIQPMIGEPFSPGICDNSFLIEGAISSGSPREPKPSIEALAGPLPQKEAKMLQKKWKTPPRSDKKNTYKIRLGDIEKGLEVIGRDLAKQHKTSWNEYWSFLGSWCNLSYPEGLLKLENHLKKVYSKILIEIQAEKLTDDGYTDLSFGMNSMEEDFSNNDNSAQSTSLAENCSIGDCNSPISHLCHMLKEVHFNKSDLSDASYQISDQSKRSYRLSGISRILNFDDSENKSIDTLHKSNHIKFDDDCFEKNMWNLFMENNSNLVNDEQITMKHQSESHDSIVPALLIQKISKKLEDFISSGENFYKSLIKPNNNSMDSILAQIQYMCQTVTQANSDKTLKKIHCDIAKSVVNNLDQNLVQQEMQLVYRYIKNYLHNCDLSSSSDDEEKSHNQVTEKKKHCKKKFYKLHLHCIFQFISNFISSPYFLQDKNLSLCNCVWELKHNEFINLNYGMDTIDTSEQSNELPLSCDEDQSSDEEFYTPPSSIGSCDSPKVSRTPEHQIPVFIQGRSPSKLDVDALRAIGDTDIDPVAYPEVYRWKNLINSFSSEAVDSWPSPANSSNLKTNGKKLSFSASYHYSPVQTSTPFC